MHLDRVIHQIKDMGMKAGVSLNPSTPVSLLKNIIGDIDVVLLMSVNPGFGAQKFIPYTLDKVRELRALIDSTDSKALIEIDGGVKADTGKLLAEAGCDMLVAGNYVFSATNPAEAVRTLIEL